MNEISPSQFEQLTLHNNPDAVLIVTGPGIIVHWNAGAERIFGYSSAEAIGRSLVNLLVPSGLDAEQQRGLKDTMIHGSATFESLRRRKDGSLVYVATTSLLVEEPNGTVPLMLLTKKDVTDVRVRQDAMHLEATFSDLLESTPDGMIMVNPTGHIVFANVHAHELFGYLAGELTGKTVEILLPERHRSSHARHRLKFLARPRSRSIGAGLNLSGLRNDGREFPIEIRLKPLRLLGTQFVMSAICDVSDRKRIAGELVEKNLALEHANRAKDLFLASMSHELRTPLNAIIGFTGTMLMKLPGPLNADQVGQLQIVQSSARHLLSLISDLLDIAKIAADKLELKREITDCNEVLNEVAGSLRPQAESKGFNLSVSMPKNPLMLLTDRRALSQIIINLTANAIKYTDAGAVRLRMEERRTSGNRVIAISVEDTGRGIAAEDQPKLFSAFSRVDESADQNPPGTGLGLHLSRQLAERLGGGIQCRSDPGKGSVFTLELVES